MPHPAPSAASSAFPNAALPFAPVLGHRPQRLIGRNQELSDFLAQIQAPPQTAGGIAGKHRQKTTLISGGKGMGKTALLLELCDWAANAGYAVLRPAADQDAAADLIFHSQNGPTLVAVDDVTTASASLRHLASAYFSLLAEGRNVALVLAGPPVPFRKALTDSVLSRLKLGTRVELGPLPAGAVQARLQQALPQDENAASAHDLATATQGHPLLLQMIGFYLSSGNSAADALAFAQADFSDAVLRPLLAGLSPIDLEFLRAMTPDAGPTSVRDLRERTGWTDNYLQPYRARLINAGVIVAPRRGCVAFSQPFFRELLASEPL
ncbi:MAG: hypothetical protein Q4D06_10080 [Coriobacteriia bacterium]|nr:hypothetical protein [Coriobacteriia bacterium]